MRQKVYTSKNNMATFRCPGCGKIKRVDISKYLPIKKLVRLKCKCICKHVFSAILERRKQIRKETCFNGNIVSRNGLKAIVVRDISRSGMKVEIPFERDIDINEQLLIRFSLDDCKESMVEKPVVVKNKFQKIFGVEFLTQDHYDSLGSYLLYDF